jgi:hypothetical protein
MDLANAYTMLVAEPYSEIDTVVAPRYYTIIPHHNDPFPIQRLCIMHLDEPPIYAEVGRVLSFNDDEVFFRLHSIDRRCHRMARYPFTTLHHTPTPTTLYSIWHLVDAMARLRNIDLEEELGRR